MPLLVKLPIEGCETERLAAEKTSSLKKEKRHFSTVSQKYISCFASILGRLLFG
jgi:hypothetical protein